MQIGLAGPGDLDSLKVLLKACDLPADDISTSLLKHFFVIKDNNQIVGSVGLEVYEEFGLLRSLALAETLRGQGLGIQLVEHIEAYATSQQITSLYLLTTTADRFFVRIGYQEIQRASAPITLQETAEFQSICPASAVCMCKI